MVKTGIMCDRAQLKCSRALLFSNAPVRPFWAPLNKQIQQVAVDMDTDVADEDRVTLQLATLPGDDSLRD